MPPHEDPATLRDRMLDAAEAVVVRQGIGNLTLEAVAANAGMSKGGLLHHFPTKDRLIEGMVTRCAGNWRACVMSAFDETPPGPGRMARAMLSHLDDAQEWTDQCQRSSSAVFAALVQNPALIEPMRGVYGELRAKMAEDKLEPGVGEVVCAAMDGLWLYRVLGLATVDQVLMTRIRRVLETLMTTPVKSKRQGAKASARKTKAKRTTKPAKSGVRGGSR